MNPKHHHAHQVACKKCVNTCLKQFLIKLEKKHGAEKT